MLNLMILCSFCDLKKQPPCAPPCKGGDIFQVISPRIDLKFSPLQGEIQEGLFVTN